MRSKFYIKLTLLVAVVAFIGFTAAISVNEANSAAKKKVSSILDPTNPNSVLYLDTKGKLAGTGDPTKPVSEAWRAGQAWHPKALQAAGLPKDRYGLVDWARLVREGLIAPRHSLNPDEDEFPPLEVDVIIPAKGDFVKDVLYPHKMHTYWLNCENCHPSIFEMGAGANRMSMIEIANGEWCGRCHGKVAFPLTDCSRCHTEPKAARR
jgi:c(7)-type cytochrome triheme protein